MFRSQSIAASLTVAMSVVCATPALGADESGTFRMLMSLTRDYTSIDLGETRVTAGSLEGTGTILSSSGAPFVEGAHSIATCVIYAKQSPDALDLESVCAVDAGSGDGFTLLARRSEGDFGEGASGTGRVELEGATGAFARVRGSCSYEPEYLPNNRAVATAECQWHRP